MISEIVFVLEIESGVPERFVPPTTMCTRTTALVVINAFSPEKTRCYVGEAGPVLNKSGAVGNEKQRGGSDAECQRWFYRQPQVTLKAICESRAPQNLQITHPNLA